MSNEEAEVRGAASEASYWRSEVKCEDVMKECRERLVRLHFEGAIVRLNHLPLRPTMQGSESGMVLGVSQMSRVLRHSQDVL
jgi:hypothetical protein